MEEMLKKIKAESRELAIASSRARRLNQPPPVAKPTIISMAMSASKSLKSWAEAGFQKAPQIIIDDRLSICKKCDFWSATALKNTGRCRKCGCSTWAKLRMATEKCPLDKWGPVTPSSPEQQPNTN